jgi:hypothetical protein
VNVEIQVDQGDSLRSDSFNAFTLNTEEENRFCSGK